MNTSRDGTIDPRTSWASPPAEGYAALGGLIVAILVVVAAVDLMRRRGGKTPAEPAKPHAGDLFAPR